MGKVSKEKNREYQRRWYKKNKEKQIARTTARKQRIRDWLLEYKSSLSCEICGENHPACLDFHHIDDEKKERGISQLISDGINIKKILEEISKCQVLCANCHRKLHYDRKP